MSKANRFNKNDAGFTGLEAAIVLIAFVVVAAVFSYVMLGAGFFTSEKAKQTVHTGVDMATSSVQTSGDIIATGASDSKSVSSVILTLQLTAGNNPIDLSKTIVSFQDKNSYVADSWDGNDLWVSGTWSLTAVENQNISWIHPLETPANNLLDAGEMAQLIVPLPTDTGAVTPNDEITLTVIPPQGATLPVTVTVPGAIHDSMALY